MMYNSRATGNEKEALAADHLAAGAMRSCAGISGWPAVR